MLISLLSVYASLLTSSLVEMPESLLESCEVISVISLVLQTTLPSAAHFVLCIYLQTASETYDNLELNVC